MSVVTFALERVKGSGNKPGEITTDEVTFNPRFIVIVNDALDGQHTIYAHPSCPKIGSIYALGDTVNPFARAKSVRIIPDGGRYDDPLSGTAGRWKWIVEVQYSTKKDDQKDPKPGQVAKVYFDTEQYDRPFEREIGSTSASPKPVLNSAKQPFDPPAIYEDNRIIIRIEKSVPSFDAFFVDSIQNTVNSTSFYGYPANTLRITKVSASPQEDADSGSYYNQSVEMQYARVETGREEPHQAYILDMGRYELAPFDPTSGETADKVRPIKDTDGQPIVDPALLGADGKVLPRGADPHYPKFQRYRKVDFNLLGLYP